MKHHSAKLSLRSETVRHLTSGQLSRAAGGIGQPPTTVTQGGGPPTNTNSELDPPTTATQNRAAGAPFGHTTTSGTTN